MKKSVMWAGLASLLFVFILYNNNGLLWLERSIETLQFKTNRNTHKCMVKDIIIVNITDETLEWGNESWGRWPWQKIAQSQILELLTTAIGSPRLIAYDIPFAYPDLTIANDYNVAGVESDNNFAQMLTRLPTASLALTFKNKGFTSPQIKSVIKKFGIKPNGAIKPPVYTSVVAPMHELCDAVKNVGHRNFILDSDGIVRSVPLFIEFQNRWYPSLSLVTVCNWFNIAIKQIQINSNAVVLHLPNGTTLNIPIDEHGRCNINYFGSYYRATSAPINFANYYHLNDFKDKQSILFLLKEINTPEIINLRSHLSDALRKQIYAWDVNSKVPKELINNIKNEFNGLISKGTFLYKEGSINFASLSSEAKHWLKIYRSNNATLLVKQKLTQYYIQNIFHLYLTIATYRNIDWSDLYQVSIRAQEANGIISLEDRQFLKSFKNKIVLFNITAAGIIDFTATPFGNKEPTMGITANSINTIIANDFIYQEPKWLVYGSLIILGLIAVIVVSKFGTLISSLFTILVLLSIGFIAKYLFYHHAYYLEVTPVALPVMLVFVNVTLAKYYLKEKEKAKIKDAFSKYVSSDVVDDILNHPDKCSLGGIEKELTIFFSDLSGFTTISEKFKDNPAELVTLLNHYLNSMSQLIQAEGGTVDRYEGDAIFAFFNAPLDLQDHHLRACRAALNCQRELDRLRKQWLSEGLPDVKARIGINTGMVTVGNMGARDKMSYTVHGDQGHYAERLEQESKNWGTRLLINYRTWLKVKDYFYTREIDWFLELDGGVVAFYELISEKNNPPNEYIDFIPIWEQAIVAYKSQNWDRAIELFTQAKAKAFDGELGCAKYIARCQNLKVNPPNSSTWNYCVRTDTH